MGGTEGAGRQLSTIMCPRFEFLSGAIIFQGDCWRHAAGRCRSGRQDTGIREVGLAFYVASVGSSIHNSDRGHGGMLLNEFPSQSRSSLVGSFKQLGMKRQMMGAIIKGDFSVPGGIVVRTHISKEPRVSWERPRRRGQDALSQAVVSPASHAFAAGGALAGAGSRGGGRHLSLELSEIGRPRNR